MYTLGVDLGTTFTAAAVWRGGRVEICSLGTRAAAIPSVVLAREDGSFLTGEAAARRAVVEPGRVAREFKRRFGDSTPVLLGGRPFTAQALTAQLLASVVAAVSAREGGAPAGVCVSHPANWGSFKTDLMREAVQLANLRVPVSFTTEPEAAAVSYTQQERLAEGASVAVYDLGGGTFDAAVLRRTGKGFEILGEPEGIERLGGIDIDAAVFTHVARTIGSALAELDEDDPAAMSAVARLRAECTEAKEALSSDTDVTIPVLLPTVSTEVRLTRAELEEMIRPSLYDSIESLKRAIRSAGRRPDDLAAVLLVGGSSRIPLVAQLVGAELNLPIAVDAHPKHAIALGASWLSSGTALPAEPTGVAAIITQPPMATPAGSAPMAAPMPAAAARPTTSPQAFPPPAAAPPTATPVSRSLGAAGGAAGAADLGAAGLGAAGLGAAGLGAAGLGAAGLGAAGQGAGQSVAGPGGAPTAGPEDRTATYAQPLRTSRSEPSGFAQPAPAPPSRPAPPPGSVAPTAALPTGYGNPAPPGPGYPQPDYRQAYGQDYRSGQAAGYGPSSGPQQFAGPTSWPDTGRGQPFTPAAPRRRLGAPIAAALAVLAAVAVIAYLVLRPDGGAGQPIGAGQTSTAAADSAPATSDTASTTTSAPTEAASTDLTVSFRGSGTVSGAVNCSGTCTGAVPREQTATLHAEPADGFTFSRWIGCPNPHGADCTFTPRSATAAVTVVFATAPATSNGSSQSPPPTTQTTTTTSTTKPTGPTTPPTTTPPSAAPGGSAAPGSS